MSFHSSHAKDNSEMYSPKNAGLFTKLPHFFFPTSPSRLFV